MAELEKEGAGAFESFLRNCYIEARPGDEPLFVTADGRVYCRLDGYEIRPMKGKTED